MRKSSIWTSKKKKMPVTSNYWKDCILPLSKTSMIMRMARHICRTHFLNKALWDNKTKCKSWRWPKTILKILLGLKWTMICGSALKNIRKDLKKCSFWKPKKICTKDWSLSRLNWTRRTNKEHIKCTAGKKTRSLLNIWRNKKNSGGKKKSILIKSCRKNELIGLLKNGWKEVLWRRKMSLIERGRLITIRGWRKKRRRRLRRPWKSFRKSLIRNGKKGKARRLETKRRLKGWRDVVSWWKSRKLRWHVARWLWKWNIDRVAVVRSFWPMVWTKIWRSWRKRELLRELEVPDLVNSTTCDLKNHFLRNLQYIF